MINVTETAAGKIQELLAEEQKLGAALRVFVPIAAPAGYGFALVASAALWSTAFALYAVVYWPILTRARIDGRPG